MKSRGLIIDNDDEMSHYLNNISYYHLSGYFKPYQNLDDVFFEHTTLTDVLNIYFFDRKLRLLFLNALERIEKSFKTQFIYHLSLKYGSHCLTDNPLFEKHKKKIDENLERSKEPFIKKFRSKYSNEYPPLWILVETLSFGDILNVFRISVENDEKKVISDFYGLNWTYLYSWLDNLREIRNICAHYSRLWNRKITKHLKHGTYCENLQYNNRIFDSIIITSTLLKKVSPEFDFLKEIKRLIGEYSVDSNKMGFPIDWEKIFDKLILI